MKIYSRYYETERSYQWKAFEMELWDEDGEMKGLYILNCCSCKYHAKLANLLSNLKAVHKNNSLR